MALRMAAIASPAMIDTVGSHVGDEAVTSPPMSTPS
jgi:hypothetical protein